MKSEDNMKNLDFLMKTKLCLDQQRQKQLVSNGPSSIKHFSLFTKDENTSLKNVMDYIENQKLIDDLDSMCIISIIGKSSMKSFNSKASYIPDWIGENFFNSRFNNEKTTLLKDHFVQIDGYYDVSNRIILLHLTSVFDTWAAINLFKDLEKQFIDEGFLTMWPKLLSEVFKSLLLLFYVSNIVIITNPSPRFDIGCINMLRIIDSTRVKLQPFVFEMLNTFNKLSPNLAKNMSLPQILFIFEAYDDFDYINDSNIKFYVKQLEEQIVRLFRKTRLINSLFTISSLNSFVYIATKTSTMIDYDQYFFQQIFNRCTNDEPINENFTDKQRKKHNENMPFSTFILPHINSIMKMSNYDSTTGRCNEFARTKIFFKVFNSFKELIFQQTYLGISAEKTKNLQTILDSFHSTLDIDNRFSDSRCSKMIVNSINYYKDNLPSHYNRETHERKLMLAMQHFTVQSRGPAIIKYIKKIKSDCTAYWNNGHRMCEELSLTGNPCVNKVHRLPHDDYLDQQQTPNEAINSLDCEQNQNLAIMPHNSMVKIISACDCGRRQGNRDDPFTVKAANYDFYLKMRYKCHTCRSITRYKFFVYDSNIEIENLSSSQNLNSVTKSDNQNNNNNNNNNNRDSPLLMNDAVLSQDEDEDDEEFDDDEQQNPDEDLLSMDNLSVENNGDSISLNDDDGSKANESKSEPSGGKKSAASNSMATSQSTSVQDNDGEVDEVVVDDEPGAVNEDDEDDDEVDEEGEDFPSEEKQFLSDEEFIGDLDLNSGGGAPATATTTTSGATGGADSNSPPSKENNIIDVKCLPPMIHTLCCMDNLPARYSSWSLVCFGCSSIYSHNLGIQDQQGFVKGSHYLLPWNVTVILQHSKNMPPLWEGKRPPGIKHKKTVRDGTQFTVKIFIGVEYECFNGHRFIASKPNQILKANTYKFKETAEDVAINDMPIYMHCVCSRSGQTCIAQLMRIHIVTPKAPIHVTLNPMIQMTPNANLAFFPGNKEPIRLSQSSYWVLRLPMLFETKETGPFHYPKEPLPVCRLLKGCYGIADPIRN